MNVNKYGLQLFLNLFQQIVKDHRDSKYIVLKLTCIVCE